MHQDLGLRLPGRFGAIERAGPSDFGCRQLVAGISGLIWSRRAISNFLGQPDDFIFVHNKAAARPIQREWMNWVQEYQAVEGGKQLRRLKHRT